MVIGEWWLSDVLAKTAPVLWNAKRRITSGR